DLPGGDTQNDLRFRYFFVEDFSLNRGCTLDPAFRWWGVMAYEMEALDAGPSVAEMMLIKAECQARAGEYADAMKTIAPLRKARIATEAYTELTASSKDDAIKKVLQERRRELLMSMRWYDLKRLNANDYAADDVTVTREFYEFNPAAGTVLMDKGVKTYTLEPNSRHYAIPIPKTEIAVGKGVIEQNVY
ncbi:MAG: RagB/SusD family nutrient uptake outer membrane protein, partial [Alistipes sp.]|nr:RagB/SusD family nutrient uptake outer membrane protein [Alistipes sp.]